MISDRSSLNSRQRLPEIILKAFREIVGKKNLLSQDVELLLYSYDSAIDRALPSAVVFPETAQQISEILKICHQNKIPFVARGAGTNLCGGTIPLHDALVIAPTRMKRILSIDPQKRAAVVEPGLPNLFLKKALEPYGLFYAPDPSSQKACTIGGNIGTNAGGPHCLKYGVTSHHVLALQIVLPDGEITECSVEQPGYDMTGLFVGSEGTLGIVTRATLNLIPIPERVETMLASFPSLESAIQTVTEIIAHGIIPATLEAMDKMTVQAVEAFVHAGYPLDAEAVLLIEVDGGAEVKSQVEAIQKICGQNGCKEFRLAQDEKEREKLWEGRRGSYPAMARLAPNVLVEDGAVPRNKLPEALKKVREIASENGISVSLIFHAGDGNLHPQILFDERDVEQTRKVKRAGYAMLKACVSLGGTISGEHGIGIDKREAMRWLFTPETLALFRRIKQSFDPENLCNPDKLIPTATKNGKERSALAAGSHLSSTVSLAGAKLFEPKSEEELCAFLSACVPARKKVLVQGTKTHFTLSQKESESLLSTQALNKILEHDIENFTATVQGGIKITDLQKALSLKNQKVLLLSEGTIGGLLATHPAQAPPIRDQILGMRVALANGEMVEFGAKVMKNVAGYDALKLLLGSRGTLGIIVSILLRTYPQNYPLDPMKRYTAFPLGGSSGGAMEKQKRDRMYEKIKRAFDPQNIFPASTIFDELPVSGSKGP